MLWRLREERALSTDLTEQVPPGGTTAVSSVAFASPRALCPVAEAGTAFDDRGFLPTHPPRNFFKIPLHALQKMILPSMILPTLP